MATKEVTLPRTQLHIDALAEHLVSAAFKTDVRESIDERYVFATEVGPRRANATLCTLAAQIDDNKVTLAFVGPAPCDQVEKAGIVRPARPFAQTPLALMEDRSGYRLEQFFIELP